MGVDLDFRLTPTFKTTHYYNDFSLREKKNVCDFIYNSLATSSTLLIAVHVRLFSSNRCDIAFDYLTKVFVFEEI